MDRTFFLQSLEYFNNVAVSAAAILKFKHLEQLLYEIRNSKFEAVTLDSCLRNGSFVIFFSVHLEIQEMMIQHHKNVPSSQHSFYTYFQNKGGIQQSSYGLTFMATTSIQYCIGYAHMKYAHAGELHALLNLGIENQECKIHGFEANVKMNLKTKH